jgi:hypothetical protein
VAGGGGPGAPDPAVARQPSAQREFGVVVPVARACIEEIVGCTRALAWATPELSSDMRVDGWLHHEGGKGGDEPGALP